MKKIFVYVILALLFSTQVVNSSDFINKKGEKIELTSCQFSELKECETIFVNAFSKAYEDFPPELLGVKDKSLFLQEAFADIYDDFNEGLQQLVIAKHNDTIIGFAGFKKTEKEGQIYISQLAVDPNYWQQGIGSHLVLSALEYFPDLKSLVVIPRKINLVAREFYKNLGFIQSAYMHPGYNSERYIGYEWDRPS